jgi:endonuclease-3
MKKTDIEAFFARLSTTNPEPKGELEYRNTYTLLVAVVLSAQATDIGVNKATPALFDAADTPQAMVKLGVETVMDLVKSIGLYKTKARNLVALSQQLIDRHRSIVPHERAELEALPGVGRKTANVVLNIAFGEPVIAVDTHVFRVSNRTALAKGKNPAEVEAGLAKVVPDAWKRHAHHWLILHGRYVCQARKPKCPECLVADLCGYQDKTRVSNTS